MSLQKNSDDDRKFFNVLREKFISRVMDTRPDPDRRSTDRVGGRHPHLGVGDVGAAARRTGRPEGGLYC